MAARTWQLAGLGLAGALAAAALLTQRGPGRSPGSSAVMDMRSDATQLATPAVGNPVPGFQFTDLSGRTHTAESLRGSVVLLDLWASWCAPCREEMPEFEKLQSRYGAQGLRVIGVSIDMTPNDAEKFAHEVGVTYPIVHKPDIMGEWGLLGLPTTFIIDREGIIRRIAIGFEYADSFEQTIRTLL